MNISGHPFETSDVPLGEWLKSCGFIPGETVWMCSAAEATIRDFELAASSDRTVKHRRADHKLTDVLKLEARNLTGDQPVWKGTLQAPSDGTTQDQHVLATINPATGKVVVFLQVIGGREDNRARAQLRVAECRH